MRKVFLYLYPIKEFSSVFTFSDESLYEQEGIPKPFPILNEAIDKRYREKGYEIYYALYPDKEMYGIEKKDTDKIIDTDISFSEASAIDENGNRKENFEPKYPNEMYLLNQIGDIDELVVGGYHAMDCVKKVAEVAYQIGIDTLVDLDLTDLFFNLYKKKDYFRIDEYSKERYKENSINRFGRGSLGIEESLFENNYSSPVYGFNKEKKKNERSI